MRKAEASSRKDAKACLLSSLDRQDAKESRGIRENTNLDQFPSLVLL